MAAMGFPMVCMDARRAADAIKSRRIKSDKADAWALAEMLRTGWFTAVHVKTAESHKIKTLLGARDQLVRVKRSLGNQVRGLLRPFGVKLPSRAGMKSFAEAAHQAVQNDRLMRAGVSALLEALASIDAQIVKLDEELKDLARRNEVAEHRIRCELPSAEHGLASRTGTVRLGPSSVACRWEWPLPSCQVCSWA